MKFPLILILTAVVIPSLLLADAHEAQVEQAPGADAAPLCEEAMTVFQDVSGMGRKDRAAGNMTRSHARMAQSGWRFSDMEIYTENGDLEGFFLTYTRAAACPDHAGDDD
jgi:hypothetical protein